MRAAASSASTLPASTAPVLGSAHEDDVVRFRLHKFLQEIGAERDTYTTTPEGRHEAHAVFSFRDRGSTVPLAASYGFDESMSLERYEAWGRTSRMSTIADRVIRESDGAYSVRRFGVKDIAVRPAGPVAAISGYAPVLAQDLLLRTWVARGRPSSLSLLPEGTARFDRRGDERYTVSGREVTLEHVAVSGVVWGREDVWLEKGKLVALVTRDAEFDHFEAAQDAYVEVLPALAASSGKDGVAWLAETARKAEGTKEAGPVALVGAQLVDGTGRPPIPDSVVVYEGDRILAAGPAATTKPPAGARIVDVHGKTVIPGLWDMHAHLEQVEQGVAYLAAGVTTVRDLGNILEFVTGVRDAIDRGEGLGPRVKVSGLVDGEGPSTLGTIVLRSTDDINPVLDRLVKAGALEVKIYSSFPKDLVRPLVAAAHRRGLGVTGHLPRGMNALEAVDAGFDGINHLTMLLTAMVPEVGDRKLSGDERRKRIVALDLKSPAAEKVFATLAAKKTVVDDTLALEDLLLHTREQNEAREPGIDKQPPALRDLLDGVDRAQAELANAVFDKEVAILAELHKRGVRLVPGTDISVPGHSLHRELEIYVLAGFTPLEAITAATRDCARVLHADKTLGTIEPGKRADMVVLGADPLKEIRNIRTTEIVVAAGKAHDTASLWKMVGFRP